MFTRVVGLVMTVSLTGNPGIDVVLSSEELAPPVDRRERASFDPVSEDVTPEVGDEVSCERDVAPECGDVECDAWHEDEGRNFDER